MGENEKREIPFAPGYFIDKHGIVYHNQIMLKPFSQNKNGLNNYVAFRCTFKGQYRLHRFNIATLMGICWLGAKYTDIICFKDRDITNCELDNLYVGDKSTLLKDNFNFKVAHGLKTDKRLTKEFHRNNKPIYQVDPKTLEIVRVYPSIDEASKQFDIPIASLEHSCLHPTVTCMRYKWLYAEDYDDWVRNYG